MNDFNLDKAVQQWCELVLSNDSIKSKNIDELKDHLYCQIEYFQGEGEDEQQAFKSAIMKMGEVKMLSGEYEKNRSFLQKLCAFEYGTVADHTKKTLPIKVAIIQQSIMWAAAMIASSLVIDDKQQAMTLIFIVLLPLSIANIIALKTGAAGKEFRYIKNTVAKWFQKT
ncbi:hypothetical protein AADZ91_16940 [Colwelliaceae bacterium 6441]